MDEHKTETRSRRNGPPKGRACLLEELRQLHESSRAGGLVIDLDNVSMERAGPSLEQLRDVLPEIGPDDDALAALAAIKERVRAGDRYAGRVRILEERLRSIDELIRGRRDQELMR